MSNQSPGCQIKSALLFRMTGSAQAASPRFFSSPSTLGSLPRKAT